MPLKGALPKIRKGGEMTALAVIKDAALGIACFVAVCGAIYYISLFLEIAFSGP